MPCVYMSVYELLLVSAFFLKELGLGKHCHLCSQYLKGCLLRMQSDQPVVDHHAPW
jgi:hypothetical protein